MTSNSFYISRYLVTGAMENGASRERQLEALSDLIIESAWNESSNEKEPFIGAWTFAPKQAVDD